MNTFQKAIVAHLRASIDMSKYAIKGGIKQECNSVGIICPKCKGIDSLTGKPDQTIYLYTRQERSADEAVTTNYECLTSLGGCGYKWKSN